MPRVCSDMEQRDLSQFATALVEQLFNGTFTISATSYIAPDESQLDETHNVTNRRLSLSETLHSFSDSPAVTTRSAKKRRLHSEMVANGEKENEELIRVNAELNSQIARLTKENQRLKIDASKVDQLQGLHSKIRDLEEKLALESEKNGRIKELEREKELLLSRVERALVKKDQALFDLDDVKKQNDLLKLDFGEREKIFESTQLDLTT